MVLSLDFSFLSVIPLNLFDIQVSRSIIRSSSLVNVDLLQQSPRRERSCSSTDTCTSSSILLELKPRNKDRNNNDNQIFSNRHHFRCPDNFGHKPASQDQMQRYHDQINFMRTTESNFVAMEAFFSLEDFKLFIEALLNSSSSMLLQVVMNQKNEIIVFYQPAEKFKHDYIVLKIKEKHFLFLEPF